MHAHLENFFCLIKKRRKIKKKKKGRSESKYLDCHDLDRYKHYCLGRLRKHPLCVCNEFFIMQHKWAYLLGCVCVRTSIMSRVEKGLEMIINNLCEVVKTVANKHEKKIVIHTHTLCGLEKRKKHSGSRQASAFPQTKARHAIMYIHTSTYTRCELKPRSPTNINKSSRSYPQNESSSAINYQPFLTLASTPALLTRSRFIFCYHTHPTNNLLSNYYMLIRLYFS